ncbi:MAG TPA: winged helix-turn-helix domain-containing protein [Candidatus Saccharimonadales bacterium]|nr:winged helix-turn-helix domain-containing protein [Candidatus Saccharimonadales bacterium]
MGKTLETKKRILNLLKKNDMTITELSRELGLSTATISQHMDELQGMGAVEKLENEHFKRLKYYRIREAVNMNIAKYVIGALVIIAAVSALYFYAGHSGNSPYNATAATNSTGLNGTATVVGGGGIGALACPFIRYHLNGSIANYSGFSLYQLNSSMGNVSDYVIGNDSIGMFYVSERVSDVLNNTEFPDTNLTHFAVFTFANATFGSIVPGINATISPMTYNAVNGTTVNFTIGMDTANVESGTYWLRIDWPCEGGVQPFLVTVGSGPYNGNVTMNVVPYA